MLRPTNSFAPEPATHASKKAKEPPYPGKIIALGVLSRRLSVFFQLGERSTVADEAATAVPAPA